MLIDALVAMLMLALSLGLAQQALGRARDVADVALETRRAQTLLTGLIERGTPSFAVQDGESDGFRWRVETTTTGAERPIEVCRRAVSLENLRTGRAYRAATLEACPLEPAP